MARLNPNGMATKDLLALYNEHANELGEPNVTRFADRETAERRTIAIHDRVVAARAKKTKANADVDKAVKTAIAETDGARAPVPVAAKTPRWARLKEEKPGVKAYKPKPGTIQDDMYRLLTQPQGVDIHVFCQVIGAKSPDRSWKEPAGVWSGLRYLFCALRGYGLSFDGKMIKLIVPPVEQAALPAKQRETVA